MAAYSSASLGQRRLWFLQQMNPTSPFYNNAIAVHLVGTLDAEQLERGLNEIVQRHEVLRTRIVVVDGEPVPEVVGTAQVFIQSTDLRSVSEAERLAEGSRLLQAEARRPFDLSQVPLLRGCLFQYAEEDHILLITIHHIISDGWSLGILFRELSQCYTALTGGVSHSLPELPIQYSDYATWQQNYLQGEVLKEQLTYWKQQLQGAPTILELPAFRTRPLVQTYRGALHTFELSPALSEKLYELSRQENVTLFMTMLAAFNTLLYRYTNQSDILVGSPVACRNRAEIEGLIGFFVNTLVLRTDLSGDPTFRELLKHVQRTCVAGYAHQDLPFEKLVEELQPERSLSRNPLCQVHFAFIDRGIAELKLSGVVATPVRIDTQTAKFDLTCMVEQEATGIIITFEYSTDLFDAATITRMAGHYQTLLEGIVANPAQRLSELPLLTEGERHQLLIEWNQTQADYPQDKCIHELFEQQAERTPEAVAVVFEGQQLTYRELNCRANQLAHYLQKCGVGPEALVGLCAERSLEMVVAILGILKAGGAYMPLDPSYPKERLDLMLQDTQALVLLTQEQLVENFLDHQHLVLLDRDWGKISQETAANPVNTLYPDNLAYVIYTSGSTGKPKGVMARHGSLRNYSDAIVERLGFAPGASYAMVQPIMADASVTVLFPPLCTGGTIHVLSRERILNVRALADYFLARPIDCFKIAPSHLAALQYSGPIDRIMPRRWLIIGGEASNWDWTQAILAAAPDCHFVNQYGPTEATVGVLTYRIEKSKVHEDHLTTPIGRPIANAEVYILDAHLNLMPTGVPGELYIGGPVLARGYLGHAELTAEAFIPNLFSDKSGDRLYKTGDVARYLPNGNIEFLGRADDQVKIRGFRIELAEIESALREHPGVQEAVVITRESGQGQKHLVAYIVPRHGQEVGFSDVSHFLRKKLPEYMMPSLLEKLDALPLTAHGKVNRRALPSPEKTRLRLPVASRPPLSATEELLVRIWQDVLGLEYVGVNDNFFDLGGHSLLATQIISRTYHILGADLPLRSFFESPTVAEQANVVIAREASHGQTEIIARALQAIDNMNPEQARQILWRKRGQ